MSSSESTKIKISDKAEGIIERQFQNTLIGRREISIKVYHMGSGTPSRKDMIKSVAQALGVQENLIVVRKIFTSYGAGISNVKLHVYNSREVLEKIEPKYLLDRDAGTKQKKGGGGKSGKE
ncbi:30S ribosomal protein S24e [Sulfolobus sp. A20]|uniref:30S ribosomal protein S24e n=1 Tax=Sulfolobaceae TaxID=118883 RepID=UPI000846089A|nr:MULTISPECIES: 30S ribosomal protein S24e [unclassified Sulfolobus]TRM76778.1 30S ribosomal protein S24e [Sulfolobus sp. B5]TRM82327.1 30S ribosomal protein S24e [Sulfolobus sp. D5]TRM85148.1 30S ribosomal protein S24e [Sulfolobus sp. F3]TRM89862.1 30S ribosomal protein S24e [Sulfolobus sp. C3]TRM93639.1 30S ribosomal protein S24e [Sulfolobus sp. A20-N-G8]TRM99584.1 30S ribosomal protein S24e [Sulfolobus sp. E1]TRN04256.1 30S ribosomal protein S24e [Sulfolobus sp. F1]